MKKVIVVIILLTFLFTACGKKGDDQGNKKEEKKTSEVVQTDDTEKKDADSTEESGQQEEIKETESSERIYEPQFIYDGEPIDYIQNSIGTVKAVYDVPNYQIVEEGLTKLYVRSGKLCIATTIGEEGAAGMALEDVFPATEESFGWAMDSNLEGGKKYHTTEITETEKVTINGVDCLRFIGEIDGRSRLNPDKKAYGYHVRGYAFVKDDIPVTIIGVTLDNGEEGAEYVEQYTKEVDHNVDELMKTLRDEKYYDEFGK